MKGFLSYMWNFETKTTLLSILGATLIFLGLTLPVLIPIYHHHQVQQEVQTPDPVDKRPQLCDNMYNVGKHQEWSECMGVGYVTD